MDAASVTHSSDSADRGEEALQDDAIKAIFYDVESNFLRYSYASCAYSDESKKEDSTHQISDHRAPENAEVLNIRRITKQIANRNEH